jgi:RsiW-degrading membrane proteinase PrsW (M82 family)
MRRETRQSSPLIFVSKGDPMAAQPPAPPNESRAQLSRSTIFPLVGDRSTLAQEHLPPIITTVVAGVALVAVPLPGLQFNAKPEINEAWQVYLILALYIAFLVNYYVNQMCGRARPWWLIAAVALFTCLMLGSSYWGAWFTLFYNVLPAAQWQKSPYTLVRLAGWWFGTGLCEEGFKAWPLLGLAVLGTGLGFLGRHAKGRLGARLAGIGKRVGLFEPLDGIVLGVASGSGFFIAETLGQYVPKAMSAEKYAGSEAFNGLVLLLGRGLPEIAEHSAWSGLFGYFIGLSVLRPGMAIVLLPLGWLSAAALHASWDGIGSVSNSALVVGAFLVFVGVLSYALLAGAIFKAREISPSRTFDSATPARPEAASPPPIPGPTLVPLTVSDFPDGD